MEIYCQCTPQGLVPLYGSDYEEKKRLKDGVVYKAEIRQPRNYLFHKKFFALLNIIVDNMPERMQQRMRIASVEDMLLRVKVDLGMFRVVKVNRRNVIQCDSISFGSMDEATFEHFYFRVVNLATTKYLRGLKNETLMDAVEDFM